MAKKCLSCDKIVSSKRKGRYVCPSCRNLTLPPAKKTEQWKKVKR